MAKKKKQRIKFLNKKVGQAPGSMVYTGKKLEQKLFIESFNYNINTYQEKELPNVEEAFEKLGKPAQIEFAKIGRWRAAREKVGTETHFESSECK